MGIGQCLKIARVGVVVQGDHIRHIHKTIAQRLTAHVISTELHKLNYVEPSRTLFPVICDARPYEVAPIIQLLHFIEAGTGRTTNFKIGLGQQTNCLRARSAAITYF